MPSTILNNYYLKTCFKIYTDVEPLIKIAYIKDLILVQLSAKIFQKHPPFRKTKSKNKNVIHVPRVDVNYTKSLNYKKKATRSRNIIFRAHNRNLPVEGHLYFHTNQFRKGQTAIRKIYNRIFHKQVDLESIDSVQQFLSSGTICYG